VHGGPEVNACNNNLLRRNVSLLHRTALGRATGKVNSTDANARTNRRGHRMTEFDSADRGTVAGSLAFLIYVLK